MLQLIKPRNFHALHMVVIFSFFVLVVWITYYSQTHQESQIIINKPPLLPLDRVLRHGTQKMDSINVVISSCGQDPGFLNQTLVLLKSAVILTRSEIHFIILTDYMGFLLHHTMQNWPSHIKSRFSYIIRPIDYTYTGISPEDQEEWKYMFKACSTQRLFIPKLFPDLDSVLYIDADTLFLDDVQNIWEHLSNFDENQVAGMAEEFYHPTERDGWGKWGDWGLNGKPPIVGLTGMNAGVILMNLTRMREFGWQDRILPVYEEFGDKLYADQGIINVIFHRNMDKLYTLPCRWNYWYDYCRFGICCFCESAQDAGVGILHHTGFKWDDRKDIHSAMFGPYLDYNFEDDLTTNLLIPLKKSLESLKGVVKCAENAEALTKGLELIIENLQRLE